NNTDVIQLLIFFNANQNAVDNRGVIPNQTCIAPALTTEAQEAAEKKARPAMVDAIKRTYPAALESLEESATNVHKKARSRRLLQEYAIKNAIADLPAALTAEEK